MFRQPIGWLSSQLGHLLKFSNSLFKRQISCTLPRNFFAHCSPWWFYFSRKSLLRWWMVAEHSLTGAVDNERGADLAFRRLPFIPSVMTFSQCLAFRSLPMLCFERTPISSLSPTVTESHWLTPENLPSPVMTRDCPPRKYSQLFLHCCLALHCCLFPNTLLLLSFCFYAFMIMIQVVVEFFV